MTRMKWTEQTVIDALRERQRRGLPTNRLHRDERRLHSAAVRRFSSMRAALKAAGIEQMPRAHWTKEIVIKELKAWHGQGRPIRRLWAEFPTICHAMRRYFGGSQEAALAAAGIADERRWTEQRVLEQIRARHERGLPLGGRGTPASLSSAGHRLFGSWNAALQAAGFPAQRRPAKHIRRSAQDVVRELQRRQAQGLPLTSTADPGLYGAATAKFGSWCDALEAAGIPCKRRQTWSKEQILEQLRRWGAEGRFDNSTWLEDRTFAYAAYRLFGSWPAALVAAGILPPGRTARRRREWTRQQVIETLQDRHVNGPPICHREDKKLVAAAIIRFGSWCAARRAAGIPAGSLRKRRRWTPESVIRELQTRFERGEKMSHLHQADSGLVSTACRYFGSWHDSLVAAGLATPRTQGKRTRWTRERLIAEIQSRHRAGISLNSCCSNNGQLVHAAFRLFGSWRAALHAAKIPGALQSRMKWDRQRVLDEIRIHHQKSLPLRKTTVEQPLYRAARRRFGSWRAAILAAGIAPSDFPPEWKHWSRKCVIDEIQARHRQGLTLAYGAPDNGRLGAAAQAWFGSWRAALIAARIPVPAERHQQWSRRRILRDLKSWLGRAAIPTRRHVGTAFQAAARRHFGSWRKALAAAGLVSGRDRG